MYDLPPRLHLQPYCDANPRSYCASLTRILALLVGSEGNDIKALGVFGYSSLPAPKAFWDLLSTAGASDEADNDARAVHWERFDHRFFAMSKDRAAKTDPQLRKLLECTYHALLRAGRIQFDQEVREHADVYIFSESIRVFGDGVYEHRHACLTLLFIFVRTPFVSGGRSRWCLCR